MVVAAELFQVTYAAELRRFLSEVFSRIAVVTFRKLAFEGIQQEVVLLLCEKKKAPGTPAIELLELNSTSDLRQYDPDTFPLNGFKTLDHSAEKWTQYYLSQPEIDLLHAIEKNSAVKRLSDVADTDIGIVTGMNDIFVVSDDVARSNGLLRYAIPVASRSNQLQGLIFRKHDWDTHVANNQRSYLVNLPARSAEEFPQKVQQYLRSAEQSGQNKGYKCSIRKIWYVVPSVYVPDAFLLRQIHGYPKLVVNEADTTSTDTIHRVRFKKKVDRRKLAAAFLNSMTFAFSEVLGRSYGGGVLELEPNEADRLPIPVADLDELDPRAIDLTLRNGDVERVVNSNNALLTGRSIGLSGADVNHLNSIWQKLRDRRIGRKAERKPPADAQLACV